MKKLCLSIVVLALAYFVVGCAITKKSTIKTSTPAEKEVAAPKEVTPVEEETKDEAIAPEELAPVVEEAVLRFDFPADYKNWTHGVSKIILDKSSPLYGFQQVYVNDTALGAYKNGGGYADGSMLVIGFYEAVVDGDNINQGDIIWYAAMKKDSSATKTAGWIFDGFDGKTLKSKIDDPVSGCYICHMGKKDSGYVFTSFAGDISAPDDLEAVPGRFAFPTDLRSWRHSNSKVILDKTSALYGFQQIYVNEIGFEANKTGGTYPDGSHITIGFYEPIKDGDTITQGDIIWYASMKKDSSATKTGGWIMDGFDGKTLKSKIDDPIAGCFICHMAQKDNDYVFSKYVP
ncbi:MAG: cytochrome P460 family protein [Candidatus Anammoxibacter sp.]